MTSTFPVPFPDRVPDLGWEIPADATEAQFPIYEELRTLGLNPTSTAGHPVMSLAG